MVAVAGMVGGGCEDGAYIPEDVYTPLRIRAVFVNARSGNGLHVDDPSGHTPDLGHIDGSDLTYGFQGGVGDCDQQMRCQAGLTCNTLEWACVGDDGRQPGVRDAIAAPTADGAVPLIQIVFNLLVRGDAVETCAKDSNGACLDVNGDGVPDRMLLLPGVVTVTCGSISWRSGPEDGEYDPSGNQFVPIDIGFESRNRAAFSWLTTAGRARRWARSIYSNGAACVCFSSTRATSRCRTP
jgi:hypothetical protein